MPIDPNAMILGGVAIRIAAAIRQFQEDLNGFGLTDDDLKEFEEYVERQRGIGWVFDPTGYRNMQEVNGFDEAKSRSQLIRALLKMSVRGETMYPRNRPEVAEGENEDGRSGDS